MTSYYVDPDDDPVTHVDVLHDGQTVCQIQVTDGQVDSELDRPCRDCGHDRADHAGNRDAQTAYTAPCYRNDCDCDDHAEEAS